MGVPGISGIMAGLPVGASGSSYNLTYSAVQTDVTTTNSAFTFTGFAIGAANTYRFVIAALSFSSATARTISSFTIGGVAASLVRSDATSTSLAKTFIYQAAVPTGTVCDVAVSLSGIVDSGIACHVWHAGCLAQTALDSGGGNAVSSAAITVTDLDVSTGGFVVAIGGATSTATAFEPWAWNGTDTLTERSDALLTPGIQHIYSAIDILTAETISTRDLTCDITGGNRSCMSAASWACDTGFTLDDDLLIILL